MFNFPFRNFNVPFELDAVVVDVETVDVVVVAVVNVAVVDVDYVVNVDRRCR